MINVPVIAAKGPVLLFGGPYGNFQATGAILNETRRLSIEPSHVICTGDLAAYCADPLATIDLIRNWGIAVVMGNCDEQLGFSAADCGCGFAPGSACDRLSASWYAYADAKIDNERRAWLAQLPRRIDLEIGGARLAVVHGSVTLSNRFVFASSHAAIKGREIASSGCDGVVGGHCGLPFTQAIGGRLWHNPGVIGLPANDGTPRVWFSILTPVKAGLTIEHRALAYDHEAAARAMSDTSLPSEYRHALTSGLWPTCDVLPYPEIKSRGLALEPGMCYWEPKLAPRLPRKWVMSTLWPASRASAPRLDATKFEAPELTAKQERCAQVPLLALRTLWFNTGTLCNIACRNCYLESSPRNDRLAYLGTQDIRPYLDEIETQGLGTREIGFTGGEPFMNPAIVALLEECLSRGFRVLVLTNGMAPMRRAATDLLRLKEQFGGMLTIRVSLDHFSETRHEEERGLGTFAKALDGLAWLARHGFSIAVAGRSMWKEDDAAERAGYAALFAREGIPLDAADPAQLVLFPEMDASVDAAEITTASWDALGKSPSDVMCATSRMVVRRKGSASPVVLSCTLIPYDQAFELGTTLASAAGRVSLNHPHCATFCVLGKGSCSPGR